MAYNVLLHGCKSWKFIPVDAKKEWEAFLSENGLDEVQQKNEPILLDTIIDDWNAEHPASAVKLMEQKAGELFIVPPHCWHSQFLHLLSQIGMEPAISMSANTLTWQCLPSVAAQYQILPFHYHEDLPVMTTMHLDRIVVDSARLFVDNRQGTAVNQAQEAGDFISKYLNKLSKLEATIPGNLKYV